jgi:predicted dehydrogenase
MNVGVIGCGLIGRRRAAVGRELGDRIVIVADVDASRAQQVAQENGCAWTTRWQDVVTRDDVDAVVVSTVNQVLAPVTIAACEARKHVLCEKPLGRNAGEAQQMVEAARRGGVLLRTGFNHRHHPAVWRAHELCSQAAIGPLMFIRAVYGHGGRPGYEKEWRGNADLAGGGELMDQGVHIVDLCRWFMAADAGGGGEFTEVFGATATYFWELGAFPAADQEPGGSEQATIVLDPRRTQHARQGAVAGRQLEDNAFALLRTADGRVAQFHTSWTQWQNRFSFEAFGRDGFVRVEGLGGSYGVERLEIGRRRPEGGAPALEAFDFPGPDRSWQGEWQEFTSAIREGRQPLANGEDGLQSMRVIAAIYQSAHTGQPVHL